MVRTSIVSELCWIAFVADAHVQQEGYWHTLRNYDLMRESAN
jgi:hypothetical protein